MSLETLHKYRFVSVMLNGNPNLFNKFLINAPNKLLIFRRILFLVSFYKLGEEIKSRKFNWCLLHNETIIKSTGIFLMAFWHSRSSPTKYAIGNLLKAFLLRLSTPFGTSFKFKPRKR